MKIADSTSLLYSIELAGDVRLHSSSTVTVDTVGGTLTIKEARYVDAGDYVCVAVNAAGSSSGKISLDVGGESLFLDTWRGWAALV